MVTPIPTVASIHTPGLVIGAFHRRFQYASPWQRAVSFSLTLTKAV